MVDIIAITLDTPIGVLCRIGTLIGGLCPANNAWLHPPEEREEGNTSPGGVVNRWDPTIDISPRRTLIRKGSLFAPEHCKI
jgi:hypothetical protein